MAKKEHEVSKSRTAETADNNSIKDVIEGIIKQFDDAEPTEQPRKGAQQQKRSDKLSTFLVVHVVGDRPGDAEKVKSMIDDMIVASYGKLADETLRPIVCTINSATERTHMMAMLRAMDEIPPQDIILLDSCTPICAFREIAQSLDAFVVRHLIVKMSDVRDKQTMDWGSDLLRDLQYFGSNRSSEANVANWNLDPAWMVFDPAMPMCSTLLVNRIIQMHYDIRNSK